MMIVMFKIQVQFEAMQDDMPSEKAALRQLSCSRIKSKKFVWVFLICSV